MNILKYCMIQFKGSLLKSFALIFFDISKLFLQRRVKILDCLNHLTISKEEFKNYVMICSKILTSSLSLHIFRRQSDVTLVLLSANLVLPFFSLSLLCSIKSSQTNKRSKTTY